MARRRINRKALNALIDLFTPEIRDAFLAAVQDIVDNAIIADMVEAIRMGDLEAAFRALGYSDAAMRPITAVIERAFEAGGVMTGKSFPRYLNTTDGRAVFRFDVRNSRAEAYLRDRSSALITRIGEETRQNVMNVLNDGMRDGRNPRNVALDIVGRIDPRTNHRTGGIVGLTPGQERWVANTRRDLQELNENYFTRKLRDKRFDRTVRKAIDNDTPLDGETIEKLVNRYKDNALKYRGDVIARTEAIQSLNASEHEAIKQAVDSGATTAGAVRRYWDSAGDDGRTRESHLAIDQYYAEHGGVGLDEPFVSPLTGARMMYPGDTSLGAPGEETIQCRCRERIEIDWFDGVD